MDSKTPKRSRARWVILAILAVILAFPTAIFLELWISSGALLKRERERVATGLAKLRAERVERPSLFEPETDGNSWDLLKVALPYWKNSHIDPDRKQFYCDEKGNPRGAAPDLDRILGALQPRIDEIRQALRRRHVEPGHDYDDAGQGVPYLMDASAVFSVMDGVATHLRSQGRHREALDALLICFGLADHLRVKGYSLSLSFSTVGDKYGFNGVKKLVENHDLERDDLARLARAFDNLDSSWPSPLAFYRAQDLLIRKAIIVFADGGPNSDEVRKNNPQLVPGWRHLFSDRILARQLFGLFDGHLAQVEEVIRRPVSEWRDAADAANLRIRRPLESLGLAGGHWYWYLKEWGKIRMRFALARLAAALAWYHAEQGDYPATLEALCPKYLPRPLVDPYGSLPFGYWVKDGEATVVSRTRDPESRDLPVGSGLGPEMDGFPAWRVRRK